MKSIEITITEDNEITIEATGFKGVGCQAATKAIEAALGTVKETKKKSDYFIVGVGTKNTQTT